jgi:hypothetical protein
MQLIRNIEIRSLREVTFDNEDELYSEKLKSGAPIFKSITFLRYQDHDKWIEFFGEERPFIVDQENIDFSQIKVDISKIKLFLEYALYYAETLPPSLKSDCSFLTKTPCR